MPSVGPENSVRVLGVPPEGNLLEVQDALRHFGAIRTVRLGNVSAGIGQVAFATFEEVGAAVAARGQSYAFIRKDRVRIVCVQGQGQGSAHLDVGFRLRLSNLPRGTTDWELRELMAGVGALHWHVPRVEGRVDIRKRFAMVDFPSRECMEGAMGRVLDFRGSRLLWTRPEVRLCYRCGREGHIRAACPLNVRARVLMSRSGVDGGKALTQPSVEAAWGRSGHLSRVAGWQETGGSQERGRTGAPVEGAKLGGERQTHGAGGQQEAEGLSCDTRVEQLPGREVGPVPTEQAQEPMRHPKMASDLRGHLAGPEKSGLSVGGLSAGDSQAAVSFEQEMAALRRKMEEQASEHQRQIRALAGRVDRLAEAVEALVVAVKSGQWRPTPGMWVQGLDPVPQE